jgi:hypothetical protein
MYNDTHTNRKQGKRNMNKAEYNKRIDQALKQHRDLLNKELSYSVDLQHADMIKIHRDNIAKVEGMRR